MQEVCLNGHRSAPLCVGIRIRCRGQSVGQSTKPATDTVSDRLLGAAHALGDLGIGQPIDEAQDNCLALAGTQLLERWGETPAELLEVDEFLDPLVVGLGERGCDKPNPLTGRALKSERLEVAAQSPPSDPVKPGRGLPTLRVVGRSRLNAWASVSAVRSAAASGSRTRLAKNRRSAGEADSYSRMNAWPSNPADRFPRG